jgi:hypothetical protein
MKPGSENINSPSSEKVIAAGTRNCVHFTDKKGGLGGSQFPRMHSEGLAAGSLIPTPLPSISQCNTRLLEVRGPDLVTENTGKPVRFESLINNKS